MFSKYFLLLAGLFLLDHGHSSHLIPLKTKMCCPFYHSEPSDELDLVHSKDLLQPCRQCADGIGLEGPDGFNCMYLSHIWSQPQDSLCLCLHGTRRTLSSLHLGVSAPPLCLCRKNWLAWHISALLLRADFLFYETWTRSTPTFLKSMSRASSPGKA